MRFIVCGSSRNATLLARHLRQAGQACDRAPFASDAMDMINTFNFDALISVDPDLSFSHKLVQGCRDRLGVVVLHYSGLESGVDLLLAGADDVLGGNVHPSELMARLRAIVRRRHGIDQDRIACGPILVDMGRRKVVARGTDLPLSEREYDLVERLALRRGKPTSKSMMMDFLYDTRSDPPNDKVLSVLVCRIRKIFTEHHVPNVIGTAWGNGYSLNLDPLSGEATGHPARKKAA
jgi:two-component system cell cycle response regulator CtrA